LTDPAPASRLSIVLHVALTPTWIGVGTGFRPIKYRRSLVCGGDRTGDAPTRLRATIVRLSWNWLTALRRIAVD
jgi:hypothetical protein